MPGVPRGRAIYLLASLGAWILSASCGPSETENPREAAWKLHHSAGSSALDEGRYNEAEEHFRAALKETEAAGDADPRRLRTLGGLAHLSTLQSRHARAESLYLHILELRRQGLDRGNPALAPTLAALAQACGAQGNFARADSLYQRVLALQEENLDYPAFASTLSKLADIYRAQDRFAWADSLSRRAMGLKLHQRAHAYFLEGEHAPAEKFYQRALATQEKNLESSHPELARTCRDLALLYDVEGRHAQAARFYQRTLAIQEKNLGQDHPELAPILDSLASLLGKLGRGAEAAEIQARARQIRAD